MGRTGAIVGPLLGGSLLAAALPLKLNFLAFAVPGLVAALAMVAFIVWYRRDDSQAQAAPAAHLQPAGTAAAR